MAPVLLALAAAAAYGVSDFVGGVAARRSTAWPVAFLAGVGGLVGALVMAVTIDGDPTSGHLLWGALAGVGSGAGGAFLYRGFASGRMGVVAPVSAVGAAALPATVGLALGERPSLVVWLGLLIALPGIWLVASIPVSDSGTAPAGRLADGLLDGILAGVGFGLLFVAMGRVPDGAGFWPLVTAQASSLVVIAAIATLCGARWLPSVRTEAWGLLAGLLAAVAVLCFLLATQAGLLTVAAVLTSLYPAVTILLAAMVLREPIFRMQGAGLFLCAAAVTLVAAG